MQNLSRILAVIDPTSTSQGALERASWIAQRTGADVELLVSYYNQSLSGDNLFKSESLAKARDEVIKNQAKHLDDLAKPLRDAGVVVKTTAVWDHPLYQSIVRHAIKCSADMVIKDTHHHSAIARAFLSNTDWNLIRTCPMLLWLVKPRDIADKPVFVAAVDPMNQHDKPAALDDQIIHVAKMLGNRLDGDVHAFHTYDPRIALASATSNAYIPVSLPFDDIEREMHDAHKKRFDEMTVFHDLASDKTHLVAGLTHEELGIIAEKLSADVIVMGAIARNRLNRLFIGSTAERTLEHLPCDLLVVKPSWFRTPVEVDESEAA